MRVTLVSLATAATLLAAPLGAQRARLEIAITPGAREGPAVATSNLLSDANTRELLAHGFTAGIHYRLELWRKGAVIDDFDGRSEWDVYVSYDPTKKLYSVVRKQDDDVLENFGGFTTVQAAEAQFGRALRVPLRPNRPGRYYYILIVEVRALTESDLDALQQWMRGTRGKSNPISIVGTGLGKLMSRILGGSKRHYDQQSEIFTVP